MLLRHQVSQEGLPSLPSPGLTRLLSYHSSGLRGVGGAGPLLGTLPGGTGPWLLAPEVAPRVWVGSRRPLGPRSSQSILLCRLPLTDHCSGSGFSSLGEASAERRYHMGAGSCSAKVGVAD